MLGELGLVVPRPWRTWIPPGRDRDAHGTSGRLVQTRRASTLRRRGLWIPFALGPSLGDGLFYLPQEPDLVYQLGVLERMDMHPKAVRKVDPAQNRPIFETGLGRAKRRCLKPDFATVSRSLIRRRHRTAFRTPPYAGRKASP